jgi:hypothetical protein
MIARLWQFAIRNPRTTIAGLAAIAAALSPVHSKQVAEIAAGIGLILSADSKKEQ